MQSNRLASLRPNTNFSRFRVEVFLQIRVSDLFGEPIEVNSIDGGRAVYCRPCHELCAPVVHRSHHLWRGIRFETLMVTQSISHDAIGILLLNLLKPLPGNGILLLPNPLIPIRLGQLIRKQHRGHRPDQSAILDSHRRRGICQHPVRQCAIRPITNCFGIEPRHIEVRHKGLTRPNNIPAIAESLTMRTIRLNAEYV